MKRILFTVLCVLAWTSSVHAKDYTIVETGQNGCFGNRSQIECSKPGNRFNGQDSQYKGEEARYRDNDDGTVSDLVTGLMWVKRRGNKVSWSDAMEEASECRIGGHDDWRAPTIKELYSLIDFNGWVQKQEQDSVPFINTKYFDFEYGNTRTGERIIDCQDWSATTYVGTTMGGAKTAFGVNFADGRIKGYPTRMRNTRHNKYIRYVRGNTQYGKNDFKDNKNGTVTDKATDLTWQQADDGTTRNWKDGLAYCENLKLGGRTDWRMPNAKELQSIVDYTRSPTSTDSAAIDPLFAVTLKESYYWTSTTHLDGPQPDRTVYVAFGRAMGYFAPPNSKTAKRFLDVHGAGAQRSDPKSGDPDRYPTGHGPQGDDIRILNYVRCVTGGGVESYEPSNDRIPEWKGFDSYTPRTQPDSQQKGSSQRMGHGGKRGGRGEPPQAAFDACKTKRKGNKCTVKTPNGTISGICRDMPKGTVCVPDNH